MIALVRHRVGISRLHLSTFRLAPPIARTKAEVSFRSCSPGAGFRRRSAWAHILQVSRLFRCRNRDISHINHGVDGCEGRVSWITWRVRAWRGEIGLISTAVCVWSSVVRRSVRSEEHTSELQSLMRISYAVFCLKKKKTLNSTSYQESHNTERNIYRE